MHPTAWYDRPGMAIVLHKETNQREDTLSTTPSLLQVQAFRIGMSQVQDLIQAWAR